MVYLRGSKRPTTISTQTALAPRASLQNQIIRLQRQVIAQRPRVFYWRDAHNIAAAGPGYDFANIDITNDFTSSATYRDFVNGDKYCNKSLLFKWFLPTLLDKGRIVIYLAKKAGNRWNPGKSSVGFVSCPDPAAFVILHDSFINHQAEVRETAISRFVSLRNMITNFNDGILERGDLVVNLFWEGDMGATTAGSYGYRADITDV